MCRLAAYRGPAIALEDIVVHPPHSLLEQSQAATEAKLRVNGDGFGIAWYGRGEAPGQYRDVLPAWSDGNLPSLCRMITSPLFLAHVRASTVGETSRVNCHPFVHGRWSFMHNGQIPHMESTRRSLEASLPDALYNARRGTTDSELLFLLLLANGLDDDPLQAVERVIAVIENLQQKGMKALRMTCVFSDGETLYAFRRSSDRHSPSLYSRTSSGATTLGSEPLNGDASGWSRIPEDSMIIIDDKGIEQHKLRIIETVGMLYRTIA